MAKTYKKWQESTPPVIPRKFKSKVIKGESEASKKLGMEVNEMKSEVMILDIKAQDQKQQLQAIDRQVHHMIDD